MHAGSVEAGPAKACPNHHGTNRGGLAMPIVALTLLLCAVKIFYSDCLCCIRFGAWPAISQNLIFTACKHQQ